MSGVVALNIVVDPYDYFHLGFLPLEVETNERLWKVQYLRDHHDEYDAYIFGSSIASQIDPDEAGRLTGSRFYNMTMSGANAWDYRLLLRHLLDEGYPLRRLLVVFDLSNFAQYGPSERAYEMHDPALTGESGLEFYASYLTSIHYHGTREKVLLNLGERPYSPRTVYDSLTGVFHYTEEDRRIAIDEEAFLEESRTLNENVAIRTRDTDYGPFRKAMAAMAEIRAACEERGIELTVIIPPHNYNYMNRVHFDNYARGIRRLAEQGGFWDFSGYARVNLDNHYYYDSMHFRPGVGDLVLRRVYGGNGASRGEFGTWVTSDDVEAHLRAQRAEFEHADDLFPRPRRTTSGPSDASKPSASPGE